MNISELKQGANLSILVAYREKEEQFNTKVLSVEKDFILISPIEVRGKVVGFNSECKLRLLHMDNGKVYSWEVLEVTVVNAKFGKCYKVSTEVASTDFNRRGAFRVYVGELMNVTVFHDGSFDKDSMFVRDISETGFSFIVKTEYTTGKVVKLRIKVGEEEIVIAGRIVRVVNVEENGAKQYGCKFTDSNNKLLKFITDKQRERQKQRLNGK